MLHCVLIEGVNVEIITGGIKDKIFLDYFAILRQFCKNEFMRIYILDRFVTPEQPGCRTHGVIEHTLNSTAENRT